MANKKEVSIRYTYDKNNKYYDKDWIANNFNNNDINLINSQILEDRKNIMNSIKKQLKYVFIFVMIILLFLIVVFSILYYL